MAELKTDQELLREYAELGSESAFRGLVERHLNLVFATALRGSSDSGAAQEITQNVFATLARKAVWLRGETSVAAWLHQAALLEVRLWWRGEFRRQRREQTALELGTIMKDENSLLKALAGELDEGLMELRESDRQALMLRYFEGRSHREIGVLLGAREDAVRMRIDKALDRLTRFFRRRGYAVPAVATTIAVFGTAAHAAPARFVPTVAGSSLSAGSGGAATGLKLLFAKFMGLTKTQTAALSLSLVIAPVAWEWNVNRGLRDHATASQAGLDAIRRQQLQADTEKDRLQAESARLDSATAEAINNQARYDDAARKLAAMTARVQGLLTDPNYRWPDDLPFIRVPKSVVKSLDLLNRGGLSNGSGVLSDQALELFGITPEEKAPAEQALANYWRGAMDLMTASAYETNQPGGQPGRLTKTVIVPPLGQPMQSLAAHAGAALTGVLGADREQLLFAGWDQGGIQINYPGNIWNIAQTAQIFNAWVEPVTGGAPPRFGTGWHEAGGGGGSSEGPFSPGFGPAGIYAKFFNPWLAEMGIK